MDEEIAKLFPAAHDAELREQIARELVDEAQAMTRSSAHLLGGSSEKNAAYRMGICDGLTGAARIARGETTNAHFESI